MRVLIVPTSRHGGTAKIGRGLATGLRAEGLDVDVSQPENMFDLSRYDGFILGSGIYGGRWMKEARSFMEQHSETIKTKPTWLFSSGPVGSDQSSDAIPQNALDRLIQLTGAVEHRQFGGRIKLEALSRLERFVARWTRTRDVDYRDWSDIDAWAQHIAAHIMALHNHADR